MRAWVVVAALLALVGAAEAKDQDPPLGPWVTASGNLIIDVEPCGQMLCGTVAKVLANRSMEDSHAELATKPALGMMILSDFAPGGAGEWEGHIYNRENGKTYDCIMRVADGGRLSIRPYVFLSLFGQTQIWQRP
jgi:uncharacterized protein (DUF2147 family)